MISECDLYLANNLRIRFVSSTFLLRAAIVDAERRSSRKNIAGYIFSPKKRELALFFSNSFKQVSYTK